MTMIRQLGVVHKSNSVFLVSDEGCLANIVLVICSGTLELDF